ncbi:DoxX family protein [Nonomuraea sp. NPDC023979]|uniref:DoxX family protein n=1 Tax=Nonomuraea sp. NPDC023979 TaxID=3154796 RepID=UPI0033EB5614
MTRTQKIVYWGSTLVLASGLIGSGIQQLLRIEGEGALAPPYAWGIVQLGYPVYILTLLGMWKLLGAVAILVPKRPLIKEWAYAGIFFLLTGGIFSHAASGDAWYQSLTALFLLILTIASWYFRPASRHLTPVRLYRTNPAAHDAETRA